MDNHRIWTIRMARVGGIPDHQIAFFLGLSLEDLRLDFAEGMQRAAILFKLHMLENLARQALSRRHPASTRFWVKQAGWLKSESKNSHKSRKVNNKQVFRTGPVPPGAVIVCGPNGETKRSGE